MQYPSIGNDQEPAHVFIECFSPALRLKTLGCEGQDGRQKRFWSSVNSAPGKSVRLNLMKLECLPRKCYGDQL